jgi:hypothetical protein
LQSQSFSTLPAPLSDELLRSRRIVVARRRSGAHMSAQRCMVRKTFHDWPWWRHSRHAWKARLELPKFNSWLTPPFHQILNTTMHSWEFAAAAAGAWRQRPMAAAVHRALHISGKPAPQRYGVPAQHVRATQRCNEGRCSARHQRAQRAGRARFRRARDRAGGCGKRCHASCPCRDSV